MIGVKVICALACLGAASCSLEPHYLPPRGGYNAGSYSGGSSFGSSGSGAYSGGSGFRSGPHFPILRYENVNNGDGTYRYNYETGNGISVHESGAPRASGPEGPAVTADGGFSYTAPDGQKVSLTYTADENGFHPTGSHIPTPPPIPEAILKSLQFNRQHPSSGDGSYNGGQYNGYNNNRGYNY